MARRKLSLANVEALQGKELGVSGWHRVTQDEIDKFADATHDHQWIHVDRARAEKESPFGGTIAHGYYTLALAPCLLGQIVSFRGIRVGFIRGLRSVRFPGPVKIGKRVRLRLTLNSYERVSHGAEVTLGMTFEVEGERRPGCIAEAIYRYFE